MAGLDFMQFGFGLVALILIAGAYWGLTYVITKNIGTKDNNTDFTDAILIICGINFAIAILCFFFSVAFVYSNQNSERTFILVMICTNLFFSITGLSISALTQSNR